MHVGDALTEEDYRKLGVPVPPVTEVTEDAITGFNRPTVREAGIPGGGGTMTAAELALFYQALLDGGRVARGPRGVEARRRSASAREIRSGDLRDLLFKKHANRALGLIIAGDADRTLPRLRPHQLGARVRPRRRRRPDRLGGPEDRHLARLLHRTATTATPCGRAGAASASRAARPRVCSVLTKDEFFRRARPDLTGPLAGVRVVEATTTWAGPMCACILARLRRRRDQGRAARGRGRAPAAAVPAAAHEPALSFMHTTVNRNKRSLTLDLRQTEGRDLFLRLARVAPTWWSRTSGPAPWTPGASATSTCARVRPDVVYVSISGFGQFGPDRERAGYDPMAQASSGWLSLNGEPGGAPVKAPTFIGDDLGGLHGALARAGGAAPPRPHRRGPARRRGAAGRALFQSNGYPMLAALGVDLPRMGSQFVVAAPAGVYRCKDDYVMLGVLLDPHWRVLARAASASPSSRTDPTTRPGASASSAAPS